MAYNTTGSTYRATRSGDSRNSFQQQPDEHIYEEQPYVNDRPISRQSIGGESRRIDFKQQPERHMYEERTYMNDRPVTRQSIGGESRRSGAVRFMCLFLAEGKQQEFNFNRTDMQHILRYFSLRHSSLE